MFFFTGFANLIVRFAGFINPFPGINEHNELFETIPVSITHTAKAIPQISAADNLGTMVNPAIVFIENFVFVFIFIWIMGIFTFFIINVMQYRRCVALILNNSRKHDTTNNPINIIISPNVTTPALIGLFKPVIVLPDIQFSEKMLSMILRHEIIHYKRKDIPVKFAVMFINAIHWFNPVMYIIKRRINALCELSCDEAMTAEMNMDERKTYGNMILDFLHYGNEQQRTTLISNLCNTKTKIKRRLIVILQTKRPRKIICLLSVITAMMLIGVGIIFVNASYDFYPNEKPMSNETPGQIERFEIQPSSKGNCTVIVRFASDELDMVIALAQSLMNPGGQLDGMRVFGIHFNNGIIVNAQEDGWDGFIGFACEVCNIHKDYDFDSTWDNIINYNYHIIYRYDMN
jgi:beta-lactamase regulating signal transducer with metallopeptidase domain